MIKLVTLNNKASNKKFALLLKHTFMFNSQGD